MVTKFSEHIEIGLNANSAVAVSSSLEIKENTVVSMQVINSSGTHNNHIIDLQCSSNNSNWHNVDGGDVTSLGITDPSVIVGARYIRARVSNVEGEASTVDVYLQAK